MANDWELLDHYTTRRDQQAFAELVRRHLDFVYASARRQLGGPGVEADDVAQAVFVLLAKKAATLPRRGALAGWLFEATRYCCANLRKTQGRRRRHEREAAMQRPAVQETADPAPLAALLDEGLARLGGAERQAVMLRFLQNKSVEETGQTLGISAEAAGKRAQRGLEKLRQFFSAKGYAVPAAALTGLLAAEAAQAAPAALLTSITTAATATAAVAALAKGAAHLMLLAKLKLAAAIALAATVALAGVAVVANRVAMRPLASAPATGPAVSPTTAPLLGQITEANARGELQLMRWQVLVDDAGMQRLRPALTAVKTQGQGYTAWQADAAKLSAAAIAARVSGRVYGDRNWIEYADQKALHFGVPQPRMGDMHTSIASNHRTSSLIFRITRIGKVDVRRSAPAPAAGTPSLDLRIDISDMAAVLRYGRSRQASQTAAIAHTGRLAAGQALVFTAEYKVAPDLVFHHLIVFEAFTASDRQMRYIEQTKDTAMFLDAGIDRLRWLADRAILWNAAAPAPPTQPGPRWEQAVPDGLRVRLVAINRPRDYVYCWWDADGKPLRLDPNFYVPVERPDQLTVVVEAEDTTIRRGPGDSVPWTGRWGTFNGRFTRAEHALPPASRSFEVGVGSGAWKTIGTLAGQNQARMIDGIKMTLTDVEDWHNGVTHVALNYRLDEDRQVDLVAVSKDGKEFSGTHGPEVVYAAQLQDDDTLWEGVYSVQASQIDHFIVRARPRHWVSFKDFAINPLVAAPAVTATAAREAEQAFDREEKKALFSTPTKVLKPDRDDPNGLMPWIYQQAAAGKTDVVRACLLTASEEEARLADAMAACIVAEAQIVQTAEAAPDEMDLRSTIRHEVRLFGLLYADWQVTGDRATTAVRPWSVLVKHQGRWMLDLRSQAHGGPVPEAQLRETARWQATSALVQGALTEVRSGKHATVSDAFAAAAAKQRPPKPVVSATQPATAPTPANLLPASP